MNDDKTITTFWFGGLVRSDPFGIIVDEELLRPRWITEDQYKQIKAILETPIEVEWYKWNLTVNGEVFELGKTPVKTPIGLVSVETLHHDDCKSPSYESTCCDVTRKLVVNGEVIASAWDRHCVRRNFSGSSCSYSDTCGWDRREPKRWLDWRNRNENIEGRDE